MDQRAIGARRIDWTIHIGVVVRTIADLMGLYIRFEPKGKKDAVLRSIEGDEIVVEWEWGGVWVTELEKLKNHKAWNKDKSIERSLKYAVLITYTRSPNIEVAYTHVLSKWAGAHWPLLLILIDLEESRKYVMGKEFKNIRMSIFDGNGQRGLRAAPAVPWKVGNSRWWEQVP
jgi:hypothetical protein